MNKLIECGTTVLTKVAKVEGMITCQQIRFNNVTYELTYFDGQEFRTSWMKASLM